MGGGRRPLTRRFYRTARWRRPAWADRGFSLEGEQVDERSGKPFAQVVTYEYEDGADRYAIRYHPKSK